MSKILTRYLNHHIKDDLQKKMMFLGGPRQVGKTTLAQGLIKKYVDGMLTLKQFVAGSGFCPHSTTPIKSLHMVRAKFARSKKSRNSICGIGAK